MSLSIVPYKPQYATIFKDLNIAWLERYFYVEPKDTVLLNDCEKSILGIGGHIFIGIYNDVAVGCFSLIPYRNQHDHYELGKMAVDHDYQGLKIGQQLLAFAINFAKEHKWKAITLYSSTKLPTALHIYRKHGFKHIELEKDLPYVRSDVKMELRLS